MDGILINIWRKKKQTKFITRSATVWQGDEHKI